MRVLGIRFGDNDFYHTIVNFLKLFGESRADHFNNMTKSDIVELFNSISGGIYWISQNGKSYEDCRDKEFPNYSYLKIEEKHVYFDDEVYDFIEKCDGWDNSEFFYVELIFNTNNYLIAYDIKTI